MSGFLLDTYPSDATVYCLFDSFAGSTGAPSTISGFAVGDILIYKNGSVTQRSSTAGFALLDTDGIDFDSITGINGFSVDLSDNTDAGFFAVGSQYIVVISTITVDGQTVSFVAGSFRIVAAENTAGFPVVDTGKIAGTSQTAKDLGAINVTNLNTLSGHDPGETIMGATDLGTGSGFTSLASASDQTAIKAKTDNLPSDPADESLIIAATDAISALIGTPAGLSVSADIAAVKTDTAHLDADVSTRATPAQILTTALTESYAADGGAPTLSQALFQIQQFLHEFAISSTTITVKKLDGTTSAMTFTLDDATNPTSLTRAT